MPNIIEITDFLAPELDVYARLTEVQLLNREYPEKGLFIAMPSRKTSEGEFKDIAHPINVSMREALQQAVLAKYEESLAEGDPADAE